MLHPSQFYQFEVSSFSTILPPSTISISFTCSFNYSPSLFLSHSIQHTTPLHIKSRQFFITFIAHSLPVFLLIHTHLLFLLLPLFLSLIHKLSRLFSVIQSLSLVFIHSCSLSVPWIRLLKHETEKVLPCACLASPLSKSFKLTLHPIPKLILLLTQRNKLLRLLLLSLSLYCSLLYYLTLYF